MVQSNVDRAKSGQWMGFVAFLGAEGICFAAVFTGYPVAGLAGVFGAMVLFGGAFVYANERNISQMRKRFNAVFNRPQDTPIHDR